jgi:hypothetical protein
MEAIQPRFRQPNPPLQRTRFAPEIGAILERGFVPTVIPILTARR